MNALGLQDIRGSIAEDNFLSELEAEADGDVVIHDNIGYPVAEYLDSGISIGIESVNPIHQSDLIKGYVVMFRNGEFEHEMEGDLYEALVQAIDRLKIAVVLFESK